MEWCKDCRMQNSNQEEIPQSFAPGRIASLLDLDLYYITIRSLSYMSKIISKLNNHIHVCGIMIITHMTELVPPNTKISAL